MKQWAVVLLSLLTLPATAQIRGPSNEWSLNLHSIGSHRYSFEGGASARNDGGAGFAGSLAHNLNDYFSLGGELTVGEFDHRASVVAAPGNAAGSFDTRGRMELVTLRAVATWYLLVTLRAVATWYLRARPITPFLTAGAGVTFLDTNFVGDAPSSGCWIYPWYGEVCGAKPPDTTLGRFSYGASLGARWDLEANHGFLRALIGGEWIRLSEASSGRVGYVQVRADFGIRF
jgi:hypothetical protein